MAAWTIFYKQTKPLLVGDNDSYGYACMTIKKELINNGYGVGKLNINTQSISNEATKAIKSLQTKYGLTSDGIVGPNTAKILFRKRAIQVETAFNIPNNWVCKIKTLESGNDPGAIGYVDPNDHGLVQINLPSHPQFTLATAIDAESCLNFAGQTLHNAYASLGDWEAAVASWNVGFFYANLWLSAGKPATGQAVFERAYNYVSLVKSQTF